MMNNPLRAVALGTVLRIALLYLLEKFASTTVHQPIVAALDNDRGVSPQHVAAGMIRDGTLEASGLPHEIAQGIDRGGAVAANTTSLRHRR